MTTITILIIVIIIIALIYSSYILLKTKISNFLIKYFHTDNLKDAIDRSEITDSETPKSISSMESIYLPKIQEDFPELNINELKSIAESTILKIFNAIENKDKDIFLNREKINSYIISKIDDLKEDTCSYDKIKFHKTLLNKYERNNCIVTLEINTSLEYYYQINLNTKKKIQDRFRIEFIYIIDPDQVNIKTKAIGLNCPNCGATITMLGNKKCEYCGSVVKEIIKRVWIVNNIKQI